MDVAINLYSIVIMDGLVRSSSVSKTTAVRSGGISELHFSTAGLHLCSLRFFSFDYATHSDFHWESAGSAAARHVDDLM